jgi:hypothetical protein
MVHTAAHPKAGQTVLLSKGPDAGKQFKVQDWFDRVAGGTINNCASNPMAQPYISRGNSDYVEVIAGTIDDNQVAVHNSEL